MYPPKTSRRGERIRAVIPHCKWILVMATTLITSIGSGQETPSMEPGMMFGPGIGVDHGGLGLRIDAILAQRIGVFGGVGYNLAGVGWNVGGIYRFRPQHRWRPYGTAFYGYHAAQRHEDIHGRYMLGTNYNGFTGGGGVELWAADRESFLHLGVFIPFRSEETLARLDPKPWPVLFSCGVHF